MSEKHAGSGHGPPVIFHQYSGIHNSSKGIYWEELCTKSLWGLFDVGIVHKGRKKSSAIDKHIATCDKLCFI